MSRLRLWFVWLACLGIFSFAVAVDRSGLRSAQAVTVKLKTVKLKTVKLENAGLKTWLPTNPGGGGAFNSPVIGPTGIWAVGSDLGGLSISRNQGLSWRAVGSSDGLTATHVAALAVDPRDGRWLIGTDDGLFTANPDGSQVKRRLKLDGAYVSGIAFAADPSVVYAALHPAWNALEPTMYRSGDAGVSWTRVAALPSSLRVLNLRTHPVDANAVIAISGEGRFKTGPAQAWRSNDAGATWQRFDPDLGPVLDVVYAADPDNLNRVYLSSLDSEAGSGKLRGCWLELAETGGSNRCDLDECLAAGPSAFAQSGAVEIVERGCGCLGKLGPWAVLACAGPSENLDVRLVESLPGLGCRLELPGRAAKLCLEPGWAHDLVGGFAICSCFL
jgi:photosystem II stability/assembly factor-like uncharacterized protein